MVIAFRILSNLHVVNSSSRTVKDFTGCAKCVKSIRFYFILHISDMDIIRTYAPHESSIRGKTNTCRIEYTIKHL